MKLPYVVFSAIGEIHVNHIIILHSGIIAQCAYIYKLAINDTMFIIDFLDSDIGEGNGRV